MRRTRLALLAATAVGLARRPPPWPTSTSPCPPRSSAGRSGTRCRPPRPEVAGRPSLAPRPTSDPCRDAAPGDCAVVGPGAEVETVPLPAPGPGGLGDVGDGVGVETDPAPDTDTPGRRAQQQAPAAPMPAIPPTAAELAAAVRRRW